MKFEKFRARQDKWICIYREPCTQRDTLASAAQDIMLTVPKPWQQVVSLLMLIAQDVTFNYG